MNAADAAQPGVPGWVWLVAGGLLVCVVLVAHLVLAVLRGLPAEVQAPVRQSMRGNAIPAGVTALVFVWTVTFALYHAAVGVPATLETADGGTSVITTPDGQAAPSPTTGGAGPVTAPGSPSAAVAGSAPNVAAPGVQPRPGQLAPAKSTTSGTTNAVKPATGVRESNLYSGAEATRGITRDAIKICGHAPLTLGAALNTRPEDLMVFWRWLNERGGIYGRQLDVQLEDDRYTADGGVPAAQRCAETNPFLIFGALGSDVIPPVRVWAEQQKELYLYGFSPRAGTEKFRYSFSAAMASEDVSRTIAKIAVGSAVPALAKDRSAIGIMWRNSSNVQPARDAFNAAVKAQGGKIVADIPIQQSQGQYTQEILRMQQAGAKTVFVLDDALAQSNVLRQGYSQNYRPTWLVFSFNLQTQTIGENTMDPPIYGANFAPAYSNGDYAGPFASYAAELKTFEAAYAKYAPNTDLKGTVGDIAWQSWVSARATAGLFEACGPNCTRNRFAGLMESGYHGTIGAACPIDFRGDGHHGGVSADVMTPYRAPDGKINWRNVRRCVPAQG